MVIVPTPGEADWVSHPHHHLARHLGTQLCATRVASGAPTAPRPKRERDVGGGGGSTMDVDPGVDGPPSDAPRGRPSRQHAAPAVAAATTGDAEMPRGACMAYVSDGFCCAVYVWEGVGLLFVGCAHDHVRGRAKLEIMKRLDRSRRECVCGRGFHPHRAWFHRAVVTLACALAPHGQVSSEQLDLRLNEEVELVGVLSFVPELAAAHLAASAEDGALQHEVLAAHPATSRAPRLHVLGAVQRGAPPLPAPLAAASRAAREAALALLRRVVGGDELAAQALLMQLVSRCEA